MATSSSHTGRRKRKGEPEIVLSREVAYSEDRFSVTITASHNRRGLRELERAFPWILKMRPGDKWRRLAS
jgi:hypothetical protein